MLNSDMSKNLLQCLVNEKFSGDSGSVPSPNTNTQLEQDFRYAVLALFTTLPSADGADPVEVPFEDTIGGVEGVLTGYSRKPLYGYDISQNLQFNDDASYEIKEEDPVIDLLRYKSTLNSSNVSVVYYNKNGDNYEPATYNPQTGDGYRTLTEQQSNPYYSKVLQIKNSNPIQMASLIENLKDAEGKDITYTVKGFGIYCYNGLTTRPSSNQLIGKDITTAKVTLMAWGYLTDDSGDIATVELGSGAVPIFYKGNFQLMIKDA